MTHTQLNRIPFHLYYPKFSSHLLSRHDVGVCLEVEVFPAEVALEGVDGVGEDECGEAGALAQLHVRRLISPATDQLSSNFLLLKQRIFV